MKMDVAVLSDIHGNYIALKRCIDYALSRNIQSFFFLGDYVGELAYPEKTMQILYDMNVQYKCYFVKGNKEDYWLNYHANGEKGWKDYNSTTGSLLYTYNQLSAKDLDFFGQLQPAQKIAINNMPEVTICHGSPYKVNEKLLPDNDRTYEVMNSIETSVILCGHTHIQNEIGCNGKYVLNPGAVGVPLYSDGKAQFLILHCVDEKWSEEFISLEYDVDRAIREMHEAKLDKHAPYWCLVTENLLRKGNISHGRVLSRAMALCVEENENCIWPNVPEKYWKRAVEEMLS
jgi:putative phosphoesterase